MRPARPAISARRRALRPRADRGGTGPERPAAIIAGSDVASTAHPYQVRLSIQSGGSSLPVRRGHPRCHARDDGGPLRGRLGHCGRAGGRNGPLRQREPLPAVGGLGPIGPGGTRVRGGRRHLRRRAADAERPPGRIRRRHRAPRRAGQRGTSWPARSARVARRWCRAGA